VPMLATSVNNLPDGPGWCFEVKLDGFRCIAVRANDKARLYSRRGNSLTGRFPEIADCLSDKLPPDTVVDGEIVALDERGLPSFQLLQNGGRGGQVVYYLFDVLVERGRSLLRLAYAKRRKILERGVYPSMCRPVLLSHTFPPAADLVQRVRDMGLEGIVAKRLDSTYRPGDRNGAWLKYKLHRSQEFVIGGYTVGGSTFDALLLGCYENGKLVYVSKTRNGFVPATRRELALHFPKLTTGRCPFANLPERYKGHWGEGLTAKEMANCCWLRPRLVAQVDFIEWTELGHLRASRFVCLRDDKPARKVARE
jgi:DNA ligase D-like protein (predicted ligase)